MSSPPLSNKIVAILALSWISAIADNLASLSLQDRVTEWHYYLYRTCIVFNWFALYMFWFAHNSYHIIEISLK